MAEWDKQIEVLRKKSTAERLRSAFGLFDFARRRITAEIRRLNPRISASELIKLVNQRFARFGSERYVNRQSLDEAIRTARY